MAQDSYFTTFDLITHSAFNLLRRKQFQLVVIAFNFTFSTMSSSGYNLYGTQYGTTGGGGFQPLFAGPNPSQAQMPSAVLSQNSVTPNAPSLSSQPDINMPASGAGPGVRHGSAAALQSAGLAPECEVVIRGALIHVKGQLESVRLPGFHIGRHHVRWDRRKRITGTHHLRI